MAELPDLKVDSSARANCLRACIRMTGGRNLERAEEEQTLNEKRRAMLRNYLFGLAITVVTAQFAVADTLFANREQFEAALGACA